VDVLKLFACQQIERFSQAKNGKVVAECVAERMDVTGPSALDIPLSLHKLMTDGIVYFTSLPCRG
jgi:hypothetical protein